MTVLPCISLTFSNWMEHTSFPTNLIDSFCSSSEVKILPFSHLMALRYKRFTTYGIRARVETLGPNWAQDAPTPFSSKLHLY